MEFRISIPPLTRILLALVVVISVVYQIHRFDSWTKPGDSDFLGLVPQWALFQPWVFFTATFAEQDVFALVIAAVTILYGGKYLERAWDSREFGKFVLLMVFIPNFTATLAYILLFALTQGDDQVYVTCKCGPPFIADDM